MYSLQICTIAQPRGFADTIFFSSLFAGALWYLNCCVELVCRESVSQKLPLKSWDKIRKKERTVNLDSFTSPKGLCRGIR